jgi:putative transposase
LGLTAERSDYPLRWSLIKSGFSQGLTDTEPRKASRITKRERGFWQRRYWEHAIRDDADLERHVDPVKHGHVSRVSEWPYSSFHRYVARGLLLADWGGDLGEISSTFGE